MLPLFSLLIIVKNRRHHCENILKALPSGSLQPAEVIVVHMNEESYGLSSLQSDPNGSSIPVREMIIRTDEKLPLAAARNLAASSAQYDNLIFLDVDCIPDPDAFAVLSADLELYQLVMADPRYLSQPIVDDIDFMTLKADGQPNPARRNISYGLTQRYELFWSLGFAIRKGDFEKLGGFDEGFVGYGGEDTDFGFTAKRSGISFGFSRALIYHQYHASYDPPLNWLEDIVLNARFFHDKWQVWPMTGWLTKFQAMEYIAWDNDSVQLLRTASTTEIEHCLVK